MIKYFVMHWMTQNICGTRASRHQLAVVLVIMYICVVRPIKYILRIAYFYCLLGMLRHITDLRPWWVQHFNLPEQRIKTKNWYCVFTHILPSRQHLHRITACRVLKGGWLIRSYESHFASVKALIIAKKNCRGVWSRSWSKLLMPGHVTLILGHLKVFWLKNTSGVKKTRRTSLHFFFPC